MEITAAPLYSLHTQNIYTKHTGQRNVLTMADTQCATCTRVLMNQYS